jgi:phosphatidylglycerophosphate synthase
MRAGAATLMNPEPDNRRPLKSRDTGWARSSAAALARAGVSPDMVSAGAVGSAILGCVSFVGAGLATEAGLRAACLLGAALTIQLRLVCNLLDGMVAVEHGRGGPEGPIWNELPDRFADALFLVGAGYAATLMGAGWAAPFGWLAALFAVLTAYVRELGRGLGQPADFSGPGAKPQRMAILTVSALASAGEPLWSGRGQALGLGLILITALAATTVARRTFRLAARLRAAAGDLT